MRELITNNDWRIKKGKKYLLLGQWCLYNKKNFNKNDLKIFNPSIFKYSKTKKSIEKNNVLYEKYLTILSKELNKLHNINWSKRSWRILIGPWLSKFISIVNNRISLIDEIKEKEKNFTLKYSKKNESLMSYNMSDFSEKILKNNYNALLFHRILNSKKNYSNYIKKENSQILSINESLFDRYCVKFLKVIKNILFLKNDFVIYKIYFGNIFSSLKLFFNLREFPFSYNRYDNVKLNSFSSYNFEIRKKIKVDLKKKNNLNFLNKLLLEMMPTIYIEGFKNKLNEVEKSFLPKNIKKIFTCNVWSDSTFKFWLANQVNLGAKLIYGQHGGGYGILKNEFHENHEIKISDKYVSWGWKNGKKTIPTFLFSTISKKKFPLIVKGKISLIFDVLHFFSDTNSFRHSIELDNANHEYHLNTNEFVCKFLKNISNKDYKNLHLKFHPFEKKSEFSFENYLSNKFNNLNKYEKNKKMFKIFKESKLMIFTYFHATSFYQSVVLNKPCVAFTPNAEKIISKKWLKLWKDLHKVGVFHSNYDSAVKFVSQNSDSIDRWWNNKKVQVALNNFKKYHAANEKNGYHKLIKVLKD